MTKMNKLKSIAPLLVAACAFGVLAAAPSTQAQSGENLQQRGREFFDVNTSPL